MNQNSLQTALQDLPLGGLRYLKSVDSTNNIALDWASHSADDFSLVIADAQTAGRGRSGRTWHTSPDSALAFSLILHPNITEKKNIPHLTGLGALALVTALQNTFNLQTEIKWPNDVLYQGKKLAGILVEANWIGEELKNVVIGIGVNVAATSVPPQEQLTFPATSVEQAVGKSIRREALLHDILTALIAWRSQLGSEVFIHAWDEKMAFRHEQVEVHVRNGEIIPGKLLGLNPDGSLRLQRDDKSIENIHFGDVHLRPFALS